MLRHGLCAINLLHNQPIVIPWDATIGIWENGLFSAEIYLVPPNAETGYTYCKRKRAVLKRVHEEFEILKCNPLSNKNKNKKEVTHLKQKNNSLNNKYYIYITTIK